MAANMNQDPDTIERDVEETQDRISETVDKLGERLSPQGIAESLIGEEHIDTAKDAIEVARRNPMPVALIAVGAVWLFATSDAPMIRDVRERLKSRFGIGGTQFRLRPRSEEPAPIGPPGSRGEKFDRRA
jgi:hypothetical protein